MKPIALVIPWFGEELKGGAEQQAWQIANRLADRGHKVEILTTCCAAFHEDWSTNHLPPGVKQLGNLVVRRFKVDKRNGEAFNRANSFGLAIPEKNLKPGINPFTFGTAEEFVAENINSLALERYLKRKHREYHRFLFIPYLYGIILNGLPLVADKALLQPCLHDEVYAYLPEVERCMRLCNGILYNSIGEERLANNLFGPGILRKGKVVGEGVETTNLGPEELPQEVAGLNLAEAPYVLYLGRRDNTKNTGFLVEAYHLYRKQNPEGRLRLILAGPGRESFGSDVSGTYDLGLVSDIDKEALLAQCSALFQPSKNESYSRVIMEAWMHGRPVAAQRNCLATAMAVKSAGGGWLADDINEWSELFRQVELKERGELAELGQLGREYARQFADWDRVIDRYENVLDLGPSSTRNSSTQKAKSSKKAIHQLLPGFAFGDAISNQAMIVRQFLRDMGHRSEIFSEALDPTMSHEAFVFQKSKSIKEDDGIIYHHSIGSGLTDFVVAHRGPKCLIYHNITPPELVREADPALAEKLEQGLADLGRLAPYFPVSAGDSRFNSADLAANGFLDPSVLPIFITPEKWNIPADPNMMARLQDGKDNILFVGRLVSNKSQNDLIKAFTHYLSTYGNARLILVGGFVVEEKYYQSLKHMVRELGVEGDVIFVGKAPDDVLHSCYRCADLFWSMSEHEGFGVPLIEAMWFDVPVLAFKSSAVPETLGEGGILFTDKAMTAEVSAAARLIIHDPEVRSKVLKGQQKRREAFLPEQIQPKLVKLIERMVNEKQMV